MTAGIESIGIKLPSTAIEAAQVAVLNGEGAQKASHLGCRYMSLCGPDETVVDLAVGAAQRALERWEGDRADIGLIAVGTESSLDEARPLSAWVAERLGLRGGGALL